MRLLDVLVIISVVVAALVVYHVQFVVPALKNSPPPLEIYVVDIGKELDQARTEAIKALYAGESVDPKEFIKGVRDRIRERLAMLPPNVIVLDRSVVLKGAVPVEAALLGKGAKK